VEWRRDKMKILPFLYETKQSDRDYFADGLMQDIIRALGRFSELTIMSSNAVLPHRSAPRRPLWVTGGNFKVVLVRQLRPSKLTVHQQHRSFDLCQGIKLQRMEA
jgi:hypothetical protein